MPTSAPSKRAPYCTASNASLTSAELALRKAAKKAAKLAHREGRERRRLKNMERVDFGGVTGVTSAPEAATPDTVALRDDMGNVYSHAPAPLIAAVRKHINELTRFLLEDPGYTADRGESQRNAMILLDKMKKGVQNSADFGMPGAVWGYAKYKWANRALLTFEAFRLAHSLPGFLPQTATKWRVISVGGGPGNDLHGVVLYSNLVRAAECERLWVLDFAEEWRPVVECAGRLMGKEVAWGKCDLSRALGDESNGTLNAIAEDGDVYLFSYVLTEVGIEAWKSAVMALWDKCKVGSVWFVKEPNERACQQLLTALGEGGEWREGREYAWVCGDALFLRKTG